MIPQTLAAVAAFFLLVAPGAFFEIRRERRRPAKEESALRETSSIILSSIVFTGLSLVFLSVIRVWMPSLMPDPGQWLRDGNDYIKNNYGLIGRAIMLELVVALALAYISNALLERRGHETGAYSPESVWRRLFVTKVPPGNRAYARVVLEGGSVYGGMVSEFSTAQTRDDRELSLGGPGLVYKAETAAEVEDLEEKEYTRVIIPATSITVMWVSYREESD